MYLWLDKLAVVFGIGLLVSMVWFVSLKISGARFRRVASERRGQYVESFGELILDGGAVPRLLRRKASDPVLREVLVEYLRFLQGDERRFLLRMANSIGLVRRFVSELHQRDRDVRVRAAEALTELADPDTVEPLLMTLADPVPEVRIQAVAALARIKNPMAVKSVLIQLDRENDWAAHRIADALSEFGPGAVPMLNEYVHRSGRHVGLVIRALGRIGDHRSESVLLEMLEVSDKEIRIRAAAALGSTCTPIGIQDLVQALRDEAWEVRAQAAKALGECGDRIAVPALRYALTDISWWVRNNAAVALSVVPDGVDALRDALDDRDIFARDIAAATLLATGAARKAIQEVDADDPIARERARSLIKKLSNVGKGEYFGRVIRPTEAGDTIDIDVLGRVGD
jgi:HEAT repeat protein